MKERISFKKKQSLPDFLFQSREVMQLKATERTSFYSLSGFEAVVVTVSHLSFILFAFHLPSASFCLCSATAAHKLLNTCIFDISECDKNIWEMCPVWATDKIPLCPVLAVKRSHQQVTVDSHICGVWLGFGWNPRPSGGFMCLHCVVQTKYVFMRSWLRSVIEPNTFPQLSAASLVKEDCKWTYSRF